MGNTRVGGVVQAAVSLEETSQAELSTLADAVDLAAKARPAFVPWRENDADAEARKHSASPWVPASWAKEEPSNAELAIELALEAGLRAAAEGVEQGGPALKRPWAPREVSTPWADADAGAEDEENEATEATERTERSESADLAEASVAGGAADEGAALGGGTVSMVEVDEAAYQKQLGDLASQAAAEHYRTRFPRRKKAFLEVRQLAARDLSISRMASAVGESIRSFSRRIAEYYSAPGSVRPGEQAIATSHLHRGGDRRVSTFEVEPATLPGVGGAVAWTGKVLRDLLPSIRCQMLAAARV